MGGGDPVGDFNDTRELVIELLEKLLSDYPHRIRYQQPTLTDAINSLRRIPW